MKAKIFAGVAAAAVALAAFPAIAGGLSEQVELCAIAVDEEGLAAMNDYRTKFVRARGASAKRLTIELIPHKDGEVLTAECRIRRGEVLEVALKS